jgi:hypothetical protein
MPLVGIGTPPNPPPAGECAPSPLFLGGGEHSLARKGLGESQFRRGAYTVVLFICTSFVQYTHKSGDKSFILFSRRNLMNVYNVLLRQMNCQISFPSTYILIKTIKTEEEGFLILESLGKNISVPDTTEERTAGVGGTSDSPPSPPPPPNPATHRPNNYKDTKP